MKMNDAVVLNMTSNSKCRQNPSYKYDRRFSSSKRKYRNTMFEKKPLMSMDTDSSDEEVILHDIRHMNNPPENFSDVSLLRKMKKCELSNGNGSVVENSSDPFQNCDLLDLKIENGETLQSISVKYQCPISDIKRANNLMCDQDFYALKHLRIPVKKYSLLTELLPPASEVKAESTTIIEDSDMQTINIGIGGRCPSPQDTAAFFKRMDEDLVKIMLSTNSQKDSLEAATVILTAPQIQPLVKDPYDCSIQWNYLIVFIIVIAVVIPTLIALYMYMRSSHDLPHHYSTATTKENFHSDSKLGIKTRS